ncbi:MAG: diacylglycerol kinase family lipid kinase [Rubricoccaceae bacterium]
MRIAFILNPAAQGGRARRMWPDLDARAQALGMDYSVSETLGPGDGERLAVGFRDRADLVVAVGGDGTVQEVATGLAGSETAFGVVPVGTGNDFAGAIGMPGTLDAALRVLMDTPSQPVDLGRVSWLGATGETGRRLFTNCLGAGIDAQAALEAAKFKLFQGRSAYLVGILRSLWMWRTPHAEIEVSIGDRWEEDGDAAGMPFSTGPVLLCEVGNGPTLGGGFRVTPDAVPNDGLLDLCVVQHIPPRRVLSLLPKAIRGTHQGEPEVSTAKTAVVTLRACTGSLPVQADGETVTDAAVWVGIEVWPGALHVVAPGL